MATVEVAPESIHDGLPKLDDPCFEIVQGQQVELPVMGASEVMLAVRLTVLMANFANARKLGQAMMEVLFLLDHENRTARRPDVAFVSGARWAIDRPIPPGDAWDVVPNLAVEIVSPSNSANEIAGKLDEYFRAGVERVWVIYPRQRWLYNFSSPLQNQGHGAEDLIDGGTILPGFSFRLAEIL